jgi:hypothetical protein
VVWKSAMTNIEVFAVEEAIVIVAEREDLKLMG